MPLDPAQRAQINRQNAQHSCGPKTPEGKAVSRQNALTHGLTATTIVPVNAPGEDPGLYQQRLQLWIDDLQPRNVLELTLVQRACRANWTLERCDRHADAAAVRRFRYTSDKPYAYVDSDKDRDRAAKLGAQLMFATNYPDIYGFDAYHQAQTQYPDPFDNAPRDVEALCGFAAGVQWLLEQWQAVLPYLPEDGQPPDPRLTCIVYHYDPKNPDPPVVEGSQAYRVQKWKTALRLLGVPTGSTPPPQPLREAAEAEIRRLTKLYAELSQDPLARTDADMALFDATPETQLLQRYTASAERDLHRSVDLLMKLRKDPGLFARSEPEETVPEAGPSEAGPSEAGRPAPKPARERARRTMPAERNEAKRDERLNPDSAPVTTPEVSESCSERSS